MVVCDTAVRALKLLDLIRDIPFVQNIIIMNTKDDIVDVKVKAGELIRVFNFNEIYVSKFAFPRSLIPWGQHFIIPHVDIVLRHLNSLITVSIAL